VLYLVRDPTHPVDRKILEKTEREEKFMAEYLNRTGIHWRHHFGLDGPRPPPVLHMWPAQEVGQIHKANSKNGYWSVAVLSLPSPVAGLAKALPQSVKGVILSPLISRSSP
jgi:hypothetical protein